MCNPKAGQQPGFFALIIYSMDIQRDIYSISRLNSELRQVLEGSFPLLWVQGEISNLSTPRSGHLYFSLKDNHAQIRCAMFRNKRNLLRFFPANGEEVLVRARIALYEPRGDCQLIIEHMEPAGVGSLRQAFEQLKTRLQTEGLFDSANKKPLPGYPGRIGIISSPSGAAVRDILHVLKRRFPVAEAIIYPAQVQGEGAAAELQQALALAQARQEADVLIIGRGGGSEEDLAVFNDEQLARAIAASTIPVISAVGHETDFTIADFVADRRAPTPSAAAELATPDGEALAHQCRQLENRLRQAYKHRLDHADNRLQQLRHRLDRASPAARLLQQQQRLDELQVRLTRGIHEKLRRSRQELAHWRKRLFLLHPERTFTLLRTRLQRLEQALHTGIERRISEKQQQLRAIAREFHAVSPLATLERGYSIVFRQEDGELVRSAKQTKDGDELRIRLAKGEIQAIVKPGTS